MFGINFIKAQPNTHIIQYRKGKIVREGSGLSFFYWTHSASLAAIDLAEVDAPFIFNEVTADYQEISVQGQVSYRVMEPGRLAGMLNFTLGPDGRNYLCDDPQKLPQRIINQIRVQMRAELQKRTLKQALKSDAELVATLRSELIGSQMAVQLGIEVLNLSLLALKPNPETARALEAEAREQILQQADEAIYVRRNASVEQERAIRENELNTEVAVENKKRQIREAKIDADKAVQEKRQVIREAEMKGKITLEEQNRSFVNLAVQNSKKQSEAQAYGMNTLMGAFKSVDPKVMQALAAVGMQPSQLIASAFQNLAENADRINNLNISPELLQELLTATAVPQ